MVNKKTYGKITKAFFNTLADLLIATKISYLPSPYYSLGILIKEIINKEKIKEKQIKKVLFDLKKRKIINIVEENNEVKIYLTEKGKEKVITRSIKLLLDFKKKNKKWNGKWFLIFFDVPEKERIKRDYLRKYLKKLGFYPYQRSVYILPFECEKEINLIKKIVDGAEYMKYIIAEKIEDEEKIKKYFNLL